MSGLAVIGRRQVVDQDVIDEIRDLCARAEAGEITALMVAGLDASDSCYHQASGFGAGMEALGALEYLKHGVLSGMSDGE